VCSENSFFANESVRCSAFLWALGSDDSHHLRLPPTLTHTRVPRRMISSRALDNYARSQSPEWPSTRLAAHNPKPGVSSRTFRRFIFFSYFSLCISLRVTCVVHSALLLSERQVLAFGASWRSRLGYRNNVTKQLHNGFRSHWPAERFFAHDEHRSCVSLSCHARVDTRKRICCRWRVATPRSRQATMGTSTATTSPVT
jgi:hypothetical protein